MSYTIYTTKAVIINSFARGEDDIAYTLFTEDFGKITAFAKSIRKISSKLRYSFDTGNILSVSLVRGKNLWRITDGTIITAAPKNIETTKVVTRVLQLVGRLSVHDEKLASMFSVVNNFFGALKSNDLFFVELITIARLLDHAGLLPETGFSSEIKSDSEINEPILDLFKKNINTLVLSVNTGLSHSAIY